MVAEISQPSALGPAQAVGASGPRHRPRARPTGTGSVRFLPGGMRKARAEHRRRTQMRTEATRRLDGRAGGRAFALGLALLLCCLCCFARPCLGDGPSSSSEAGGGGRLLAAGVAKSALSFDGRNDFALVRDFKRLPSTRMTVAAWIRVHRHKSFSRILSHEWIGWGWNLYCDGAGLVRFGVGQDNKDFAAGRIIFKNKWHFVVGRYDGEYLQAFVDGVPGAKTSLPNATVDDTGYVSIAGAEFDPFPGEIDDVRIYDVALSDEEIMRSMVRPPEGNEAGLVAYWKMDEAGGGVLRDSSPVGNHAQMGKGARAPRWVQSEAPVAIPCLRRGENLTLSLGLGLGEREGGDGALRAFVTSLPDAMAGTLYQVSDLTGEAIAIHASPVEIQQGHRLLFSAAAAESPSPPSASSELSTCALFTYKVHDGRASSAPGTVAIDVVPAAGGSCDASEKGWVERRSACWRARTEMEHVRPHASPPAVSVVIPLYNQAELLRDTVRSVLEQTFTDWEMVIVNDGSTDDGKSLAAARDIMERNERGELGGGHGGPKRRIRLVEKLNGGLADARNAGIQAASGEWIFPLDSDDLIGRDFLERAVALAKGEPKSESESESGAGAGAGAGAGQKDGAESRPPSPSSSSCNLVIADLKGFGAWEYAWHVPEYSARDLRYSNMFHCSALFHKSLWQAVPRGYPIETLFGYEDWAFWIFAEEELEGGIRPCYIHEELFYYRIRPDSMHQSLLKNQEYSIASLRMLHPNLFPSELILSAHDKFLGINSEVPAAWQQAAAKGSPQAAAKVQVPEKVFTVVRGKIATFPWSGTLRTINGLLHEGQGELQEAMAEYSLAADLSRWEDWQPRWRLGLMQQRLGLFEEGNRTLSDVIAGFEGVAHLYRNLNDLSDQELLRGPVYLKRPQPHAHHHQQGQGTADDAAANKSGRSVASAESAKSSAGREGRGAPAEGAKEEL